MSEQLIVGGSTEKEDIEFANKRAQGFLRRLYDGSTKVKCTCGEKISFKNSELKCCNCGTICDRIVWEEDYDDCFIKTTINVDTREFELFINDSKIISNIMDK